MGTAYSVSFYYDGTTDPLNFTATSNAASYIECPNTISFASAVNIDASVTDNSPAATDSSTVNHIPPVDLTVTDNSPAATDSVTAALSFEHSAAVTDNSPAATDSSTVDQTNIPSISGVVTDNSPAATDSSTITHVAPTINVVVTDNSPAATDTATATHAINNIDASVTDNSPAATDASTVTHTAPTISTSVTDSNAAATDSAIVNQVPPTINAVVTDNNAAAIDTVTVFHTNAAPVDVVVTDTNAASIDLVTINHVPYAEPRDPQWDGKVIPTLYYTIAYHVVTGVGYRVNKILRFNPRPPKYYQYACAVTSLVTGLGSRANVWYDEETLSWKCGEYVPVTTRDVDGVIKNL
jgi:hypothetical protein